MSSIAADNKHVDEKPADNVTSVLFVPNNNELNEDSKIILLNKIKTLQYQRIYQAKLIHKLKQNIKKL